MAETSSSSSGIDSAAAASFEPWVAAGMAAAEAKVSLKDARRQSLVALATFLNIQNTVSKTKQELSDDIWTSVNDLVAQVNAPPVSPIAWVLWVGGLCWAGRVFAIFSRLFFLVSCFPFVGSSLPALRGVWRCLL